MKGFQHMENEQKRAITINNKEYNVEDLNDEQKVLLDKYILTKQEYDRLALKLERYDLALQSYTKSLVESVESEDE